MRRLVPVVLSVACFAFRAEASPPHSEVAATISSQPVESIPLASLSSANGSPRVETRPGDSPPADLAWLQSLSLPGIAQRWDAEIISFLERFRADSRNRATMAVWLARLANHEAALASELRAQGLPTDLIAVALVESGLDPRAQSPAGAAGLWQFVSTTGSHYGLEQDRWVDERLNVRKSTAAAARYLKDLRERFGTWELALAAYNMGPWGLIRSIRKYNTNDFWVLSRLEAALPYETRLYVAKVISAAVVLNQPTAFGFDASSAPRVDTVRVPVSAGTSLARIARMAGVSADVLSELNPELKRGRTPPDRESWLVEIPATQREHFHARWARIHGEPPRDRYVLRFGETLAEVAHRFGLSERALRRLNGLTAEERCRAGTPLVVPVQEARQERRQEAQSAREPVVVAVPNEVFAYGDRKRVFYRLTGEETLGEIAQAFGVTRTDVERWNHLDPAATLHKGMFVQLWVAQAFDLSHVVALAGDDVRPLAVGSEHFMDSYEAQQGRVRFRYTASNGDTLETVARRFGLEVADLARINQISPRKDLVVGERIVVYAAPDRVPRHVSKAAVQPSTDLEPGAANVAMLP